MKLFLYYALHTFINQIKKLLKTWVAVFILVCFAFGVIVGVGASLASNAAKEQGVISVEEETPPDEKPPLTEEQRRHAYAAAELIFSVAVLGVAAWQVLNGDKNGGRIFLMADVNLLFSSPMKPQSVLLFRLLCQLGAVFVAGIYLLFQLPNLIMNVGLSIYAALALLALLLLLLAYAKLINVLSYTLASTHDGWKKRLRPALYGALGVLAAVYAVYWKTSGKTPLNAALALFNAPAVRWIPVWGWMKGVFICALNGAWGAMALFFGLLIAGIMPFTWIIWRLKADFYEDAMYRSAEVAEKQKAQREGNKLFAPRKKERKETLKRDGFRRGFGANVYFHKAMYNRFRFAPGGVFTKTAVTYALIALAAGAFFRFVVQFPSFAVAGFLMAGACFFRALGNPIREDLAQDHFILVPEKTWKKVLYSMLGGSANCLLDLIPAFVISAFLLPRDVRLAPLYLLFALSLDYYSSAVGVFIDLAVPLTSAKTVKTLLQVMFIYFGLLPDVILLVVGFIFQIVPFMLIGAFLLNVFFGVAFFVICPVLLDQGRK